MHDSDGSPHDLSISQIENNSLLKLSVSEKICKCKFIKVIIMLSDSKPYTSKGGMSSNIFSSKQSIGEKQGCLPKTLGGFAAGCSYRQRA